MTFLHPQLLGLLALPVILVFWEWTRRGQPIAMPLDHGVQGRGRFLHVLVLSANCLPAALLAMALFFLAHPVTQTPPEVERQLNNVQFVLDTSGSMAEAHGPQTHGRHRRFDSAMAAIEQFISHRQGDAFGLTIFGRSFIHWLPLTLDTQSIPLSKRFIEPRHSRLDPPTTGSRGLPDALWGGTFIGRALHGAADLLAQRLEGDRMIILMTDGESNDIHPPLDAAVIEHLRAERILLFTVMLTGDKISQPLIHITRATGGEVFNAVTPEALASVFQRIDEMKKVVVLEKRRQVVDFYDPLFMPALGLLAASVLVLFGLRFTPW